jgi:hypothetical protein
MPKVITQGSSITCAHQGKVQVTPSQNKLKVDGQAVLVEGDLIGAPIVGCTVVESTSTKRCTSVVSMVVGASLKFKVDGKAVLLETAAGLTDGVPPGANLWSVQSAGQTKLDTL